MLITSASTPTPNSFTASNLLMTASLTLISIILTSFSLSPTAYAQAKDIERVAVLDLANKAGVNQSELGYLTDLLRQAAGKLPKEHYGVLTKDNILVMLPPGKTIEDCVGSCAVETGRNLGAHWVLVGEVVRFGKALRVSLKLHHSASGELRGSDVVKGKTLVELEKPMQRSALSLFSNIDARVGRSASLARALAEIDGEDSAKANESGQAEDDLAAKLAALDEQEDETENPEINSDAEYEAQLKQLAELAELKKAKDRQEKNAREQHRKALEKQWAKVQKINQKSAKRGIKAISLFIESYRAHKYGNHLESEAESTLDLARERLIAEKKASLAKTHRRQVNKAWQKAKRLVKRGDDKAQKAYDAFIEAYRDHPLGNPLADEAQAFFNEAQAKREQSLSEAHLAKVERSWAKAKRVVKRGDRKAEKALKAFLEAYADHERGNPLAEAAQVFYDEAKQARDEKLKAKHLAKVKQEWSKLKPILKAKGKPADKAIKLFIKRYAKHPLGNPLADTAQEALEANARGEDASSVSVGSGKAGIKWIKIPRGRFKMGSREDSSEQPIHTVRVKAFLMSETEVTVAQYRKCVEAGVCTEPSTGSSRCTWDKSGKDNHPINCVDWGQARTFAVWAGGDLPTEAQWEYAAKGGQDYKYAGSNDAGEVAWYAGNSGESTHQVKTKKSNGYGLYDMSGNVWEWTLDEWHDSYKGAPSSAEDARGSVGKCNQRCDRGASRRVYRGGSCRSFARYLRVASRDFIGPDVRYGILGFRIRRTLP